MLASWHESSRRSGEIFPWSSAIASSIGRDLPVELRVPHRSGAIVVEHRGLCLAGTRLLRRLRDPRLCRGRYDLTGVGFGGGTLGVEREQAIDDGVLEQRHRGALDVGGRAERRDGDVGPAVCGEYGAIEVFVQLAQAANRGEVFGMLGSKGGILDLVVGRRE